MKKILVVDDDQSIRKLLNTIFSLQGYTVKIAESGLSAIKIFKHEHFDIVVSDIDMPDMCGNDLVKYCKELDRQIPFVALTAKKENACDLFDLVLSKPFDLNNFVQKVKLFSS